MALSTFALWCNHLHHPSPVSPSQTENTNPLLPSVSYPGYNYFLFCLYQSDYSRYLIMGELIHSILGLAYFTQCDVVRFTYVVACIRILFLFVAE